jgi:hypothetical protein
VKNESDLTSRSTADEKSKGPKLPPLSDAKWAAQERFIGRNNRDKDRS